MSDDKQAQQTPPVDRPGARAAAFNTAMATLGISLVVFVIGVVVGYPLATFGVEFLTGNAGMVFGVLFGFFVLVLLIAGALMIFRKPIWESLFKRGEVEMERFARPLSDVARFAALQKVAEATESARDLAELVLARYAWVSTRRWLMATITAFIAAIAALAGSALLFQQNQLLRTQIGLMEDQNTRIGEQNRFIQSQIELGEAQRSTSIVPEILEIGALVAQEVAAFNTYAGDVPSITMLSPSLRARIAAATTAARPYRYLRNPLTDIDEKLLMSSGLLRRTDLAASGIVRQQLDAAGGNVQFTGEQSGVMSDRPLSPERGQIIAILIYSKLTDFSELSGADFSFAEVRSAGSGSGYKFGFSSLRFADFDRQLLIGAVFDGAYLEHARFRNATLSGNSFASASIANIAGGEPMVRPTELAGTDFSGAILKQVTFAGSRGFGINFDRAVLHNVQFTNTDLSGGTFRGTIFGVADFTGASLKSVDFDGAIVFDPAFLDTVAAQAAPDGFVRDRFAIAPITPDEFAQHPRWADAWLDGLEEKQAYRITRVGAFE
jgi:uncharacterized protein YjbI with pentapeptide repeats